MKTKIKKDWFGREKSKEELHSDSKNWISEIKFINDEIKFLENLLSCRYIDCVQLGFEKKVKEISKSVSSVKKNSKILLNSIKDHEIILDGLIRTSSVTSNKNYLHTHQMYEKEMFDFLESYKTTKKEIFILIKKVITKKEENNKLALSN